MTRVIPMLRRKVSHLAQTSNPAQQELQLAIRCAGSVLRDFMPGVVHVTPGETTFRMPGSQVPGAGDVGHCAGGEGEYTRYYESRGQVIEHETYQLDQGWADTQCRARFPPDPGDRGRRTA